MEMGCLLWRWRDLSIVSGFKKLFDEEGIEYKTNCEVLNINHDNKRIKTVETLKEIWMLI